MEMTAVSSTTIPVASEGETSIDSRSKLTWKERILGDYDYVRLCTPRLNPWKRENQAPLPSYGKDDKLAWLLVAILGFQHSLAVVGGTVVPGILLGNQDPSGQAGPYLVSYALLTSGICTWIQILHTKIWRTKYYVGSGMLCVIARSFAFLPTAQQSITTMMNEGKTFDEAYGSLLGVFIVGAIFQSSFSFIPGRILRRVFPPWLAGLGVFLIGVNLTGSGVRSWGGGGDCAPSPDLECTQVGQSNLGFGSAEYVGLGFFVLSTICFIELFGSPFFRSCGIAVALLMGYVLASITTDRNGDSYVDLTKVQEAPAILFLWTKTFPIGFYTPALLPTLIAYVVSTIETYGDTSATCQASGIERGTKEFDEAIQGGLLGDSINSIISAVSMVLPSTTLSQNIGIISLTKVAARDAGFACGIWMFLYGLLGKVGAFFTSIPQPVLGGMSTFLFANITFSGIKVMTSYGICRRSRFIMAVSSAFGIGTIVVPQWFRNGNFLDCPTIESPAVRGLCDAAVLTLGTGYAIGCLVALFLNAVLPEEQDDDEALIESEQSAAKALIPSLTHRGETVEISAEKDQSSSATSDKEEEEA
ncbi:xanthine permease [Nitzschia inconspicua]|uniref:Xanthine permease n=1 Tax=Nitzschia inconspicua TaxID=303405 RepID=A0A9K3PB22_9STRA|nr:xanthine permease [Nitzschia inconspicua]